MLNVAEEQHEVADQWDSESSESSINEEEALKDIGSKQVRQATTKSIDRSTENELIQSYKKTKDPNTLMALYHLREPTLIYWTRKYTYLVDNPEDIFSEFRSVWYKCVEHYEYEAKERLVKDKHGKLVLDKRGKKQKRMKRTDFNTFLYTSLVYCVRNIIKKRYSKKRTTADGIPCHYSTISIDKEISHEDDSFTLHDVLPARENFSANLMSTEEIIELFAEGDEEIMRTLRLLAYEPGIKKLSMASRLRFGALEITPKERELLQKGSKRAVALLKRRIKKDTEHDDFRLISYQVFMRNVKFEVLCKNMRLFNKIVKKVRMRRGKFEKVVN